MLVHRRNHNRHHIRTVGNRRIRQQTTRKTTRNHSIRRHRIHGIRRISFHNHPLRQISPRNLGGSEFNGLRY